jgi:glycosyltransferase involved in cell wall biosynthesis
MLAEALDLNVLESESSLPDLRQQAVGLQSFVIGFVGELREKKGLTTLLNAYAQVNEKQPTALLIVGEVRAGEDKQAFDEFLSSHPDSRITVTGYISPNDLPAFYSLIDVFVHPSIHDGMPNAVLEAMACGKPVVATPVGGILDVLEDGKSGRLVKVRDVNGLAETILDLFSSPDLRTNLGERARAAVLGRFSPEKELAANLEVYKKVGVQL